MVKNPTVLAGDESSIPGSGRCWRKNWQPTPLSCLENLTVYRVTESRTQVSMHTRIRCKVTGSVLLSLLSCIWSSYNVALHTRSRSQLGGRKLGRSESQNTAWKGMVGLPSTLGAGRLTLTWPVGCLYGGTGKKKMGKE